MTRRTRGKSYGRVKRREQVKLDGPAGPAEWLHWRTSHVLRRGGRLGECAIASRGSGRRYCGAGAANAQATVTIIHRPQRRQWGAPLSCDTLPSLLWVPVGQLCKEGAGFLRAALVQRIEVSSPICYTGRENRIIKSRRTRLTYKRRFGRSPVRSRRSPATVCSRSGNEPDRPPAAHHVSPSREKGCDGSERVGRKSQSSQHTIPRGWFFCAAPSPLVVSRTV